MICERCLANDDTLCLRPGCRFFVPVIPRHCSMAIIGPQNAPACCSQPVRWMILPNPTASCDEHVRFHHEHPSWREACRLKVARVVRLP